MSYAKNTNVSVEQTQIELQKLLQRYGATKFAIDWNNNMILFELKNRAVRISVPSPNKNNFQHTESGRKRNIDDMARAFEQAKKQRWRALLLVIKAKLEAITSGITTIDNEFMPYFALPNGQTLGEYILPQLKQPNLFYPQLPENEEKK